MLQREREKESQWESEKKREVMLGNCHFTGVLLCWLGSPVIGCLHSNPRWCYLLTHWFGEVNFPRCDSVCQCYWKTHTHTGKHSLTHTFAHAFTCSKSGPQLWNLTKDNFRRHNTLSGSVFHSHTSAIGVEYHTKWVQMNRRSSVFVVPTGEDLA